MWETHVPEMIEKKVFNKNMLHPTQDSPSSLTVDLWLHQKYQDILEDLDGSSVIFCLMVFQNVLVVPKPTNARWKWPRSSATLGESLQSIPDPEI